MPKMPRPSRISGPVTGRKVLAWLTVDPLCFIGAVIDALGVAVALKGAILVQSPLLAPLFKTLGAVPIALLFAETLARQLPHGEHDMGVVVSLIALLAWRMKGDVGDHPLNPIKDCRSLSQYRSFLQRFLWINGINRLAVAKLCRKIFA